MGTADEQIRVSERVKRELARRRRGDESYNDVLARLLEAEDRDLLAGFGRWSEEHADRVRASRDESTQKSKDRTERLVE